MYGVEKFLKRADFDAYEGSRDMFERGYMPFAIKHVPDVKEKCTYLNKKYSRRVEYKEKLLNDSCEVLYVYMCRYLLLHFDKELKRKRIPQIYNIKKKNASIKIVIKKPIDKIPKFMLDERPMPNLNNLVEILKSVSIFKDEAKEQAKFLLSVFKEGRWVADNFITTKRSMLYSLEDDGLINSYNEVIHAKNGLEFRLDYWYFCKPKQRKQKEKKENTIYDSDNLWETVEKERKK